MILIDYRQDEAGLWSFVILQNKEVRARTEPQFPNLKQAKRCVGEITKVIKKGNGKEEEIKKIIHEWSQSQSVQSSSP
jgi:hypothetical protein